MTNKLAAILAEIAQIAIKKYVLKSISSVIKLFCYT